MLMKTKASPLANPQCVDKGAGRGLCFFVFAAHDLGQEALSLGENGPRRRVREADGPGEGLVMFPIDIFPLILLIAAGILSRLSLPPQSRRG